MQPGEHNQVCAFTVCKRPFHCGQTSSSHNSHCPEITQKDTISRRMAKSRRANFSPLSGKFSFSFSLNIFFIVVQVQFSAFPPPPLPTVGEIFYQKWVLSAQSSPYRAGWLNGLSLAPFTLHQIHTCFHLEGSMLWAVSHLVSVIGATFATGRAPTNQAQARWLPMWGCGIWSCAIIGRLSVCRDKAEGVVCGPEGTTYHLNSQPVGRL